MISGIFFKQLGVINQTCAHIIRF